jgi:hypothetical protein
MDFEGEILRRLLRRRAIGARHYRIDTFLRMGWKPHEKERVHEALDSLIRQGLVRWYHRHKESIQLTEEGMREAKSRGE